MFAILANTVSFALISCTVLDPRRRWSFFMSDDWAECRDDIWQQLGTIYTRDYQLQRPTREPVSEHQPSHLVTFSWAKKPSVVAEPSRKVKDLDELEEYRNSPLSDG